jgi:hypothetical protein
MAGINCGKLDLTKVSNDEIITINDATWIKADVDEKIYIVNGTPNVVIKFSDMCAATVCDDQIHLRQALAGYFDAKKNRSQSPANNGGSPDKTSSLSSNISNNSTEINQSQSSVDANSVDLFSFTPAAVKPAGAIVPMKSNIQTYGPYSSINFGSSSGGTQVEVNTDLAPWVFGSIQTMNSVGQSLVDSMSIGLIKAETGSVTLLGLPTALLAYLGTALTGGPTLSSINCTFGSNGITTSYEFKTYTPKFGGLNRHMIDKMKNIAKNRTEQLRFLRTNQITQNKISRKLRNVRSPVRPTKSPKGTLNRVLVGEIYNWERTTEYSQCTIVGIDKLRNSVDEMSYNYEKKAYMSLDGLFGPLSIKGDGGLPRYASFSPEGHKSSPIAPQPPFSANGDCSASPVEHEQYNTEITQKYLNPLTNKFESDEHHHTGPGDGHVIDMVGRESQIPEKGLITNFYSPDDPDRYSEDYRFLGVRGPIVLHSWGYDLDGKPIPNESDTEDDTKQGIFKKEELKNTFLNDWLKKPATWPAAPIDLRFDRERGLWVSPQSYRIIVAKIVQKVPAFGYGKGVIISQDKKQLFDNDGNPVNPDTSISCECEDGSIPTSPKDPRNPESSKKTSIDVIVGIELTDKGLVVKRKNIVAYSAQDISSITIETTSCETGTVTTPPETTTFCQDNWQKWWYDAAENECFTCCGQLYDSGEVRGTPNAETQECYGTIPAKGVELFDSKTECELANAKCNDNNLGLWWYDAVQGECFTCCTTGYNEGVTEQACYGSPDDGKKSTPPTDKTRYYSTLEECKNYSGGGPGSPDCNPNEGTFTGMIKIVDRIGIPYYVGELVYAYYDTLAEEYIVLGG